MTDAGIQKFNRPLGSLSSSKIKGGKVMSQHRTSFNPSAHYDNEAVRNRNLHDSANIFAGRINIRSMGYSGPVPTTANSGMDDLAKAMAYAQLGLPAGQTLAGLTKGIVGLFKNSDGGAGGISGGKGGENPVNSATINAMKSATTSVDLRAAINSANTQASTLASQIQTIEAELPGLKEAADAAQTKINDLNKQITEQTAAVDKQEADVKAKEKTKTKAQEDKNNAETRLQSADSNYATAVTNYTTAQNATKAAESALSSAEATLKSTSPLNPDGSTNPAYAKAQIAVSQAKAKLSEAKMQEREALQAKEEAYNNLGEAKERATQAETAYNKAKQELETAEQEYNSAKAELDKMQEELDKLSEQRAEQQKAVTAYENKQKELTDKKTELAAIKAEIPTQQTRLAELEKAEEAKIGTIDGQIGGYQSEIDGRIDQMDLSDGVNTIKERRLQRRNEKDLDSISNLASQRLSALDLFNDSKNAAIKDAKTNGETTYQGVKLTYENGTFTYNGKTFTEEEIAANL